MLYNNDSRDAILAMERARTGNYGEDDYYEEEYEDCPVCGCTAPYEFYIDINNECVGCSECVQRTESLKYYSLK